MKAGFAVLILLGVAHAQSLGAFTAVGSLTTARYFHTATLLPDGRVLIAGGQNDASANPLSSTEIYDPVAKTFTPGPDMTVGRSGHTATLLGDGRVLIIGGDWGGTTGLQMPAGTAEVYDPSSRGFTATGSLLIPRASPNATLLANGKVLVTGGTTGENDTGYLIADPELYDPFIGTFTAARTYAGSLAGPNATTWDYAFSSTLLSDGTVLLATVQAAQAYDPASGFFSLKGAMSVMYESTGTVFQTDYLAGQSATLLLNGKVLVAGGEQEDAGRFASAQLYDPASGVFVFTGSMTAARNNHTATLFPDGAALVAGGESQSCSSNGCWFDGTIPSAELYNPVQGAFVLAGDMTVNRAGHTATLLNNGDVLLTGGYAYAGIGMYTGDLASAELYHPASPSSAPALFSMSGNGTRQGAVWHAATGQLASPQNPATAGEILSMYVSGLSQGGTIPPQVAVGGQLASVLYFGDAPGYAGSYQVNFRVPCGGAQGPTLPVRLMYLGRSSNTVTIATR
jgi:hypothetical protein